MRSRFLRSAAALGFLVSLLLLLPSADVQAQTVTGTLQGTVTDASGGPLPGATVTVRNRETGLERRLVTNVRGAFVAPLLQIGDPCSYQAIGVERFSGLGAKARPAGFDGVHSAAPQSVNSMINDLFHARRDAPCSA